MTNCTSALVAWLKNVQILK